MGGNHDTNQSWNWLFHQLEQKESIINGISDALMLMDAKTHQILDVNQAFESLTGLQDVVGKKVSEVIPGIRDTIRRF